jgi:dipeptidyl-peptidase-4
MYIHKKTSTMFKYILTLLIALSSWHTYAQIITLEDIWLNGKFRSEYFSSFNWTGDGQHYTEMKANESTGAPVVLLNHIIDGPVKELTAFLPKKLSADVVLEDYILSPDQSKILFSASEESIYRRSSKAYYYIFDVKTGAFSPLYDFNKGKISYPTFSPNSAKIAFVCDNNIYVTEVASTIEKTITTDGKFNHVINGACDWVYEEEFEFAQAFFWSPDSKKIAYYRFDETNVKQYNMQLWEEPYPTDYVYKYPKAGEQNSFVKIMCALVEENKTIEVSTTIPGEKEYFPRLRWTGNADVLSYYRMNRLQNNLEIIHYNVMNKTFTIPYKEEDKAYVEINDNHFYFSDSENFVFTSEKDGYRHVYFYSSKFKSLTPLTKGEFEVAEVLGIDEKNKLVYYTSEEDSPMEKHLYSVDFLGKKKKKMTLTKGAHNISFSPKFDYYTDTYSDANTPSIVELRATSTGKLVRNLMENKELITKLEGMQRSKINFLKFTTTENISLNAWIMMPENFDATKKYPVLLSVYGGPGSQEVTDSWRGANYFWYQMLAQKGYIIFCVDGRGTGGRGAAFKKQTQLNLGKYETQDLIEAAKYLQTQNYVDPERIGIFGWSFGGYLSSLAITKGADYYKAAIAVAPVTNWRYYDNIYTERYMGLPSENAKGYDENAPAYFAKLLKGKYLLIHGTADDNVHLQNAIEMERALINANKQFDMFYYPDKNHGIYGGTTRFHLYKMMTEFILKNL